jgi:NADH-quinone oxidoreductase E subunit
MFSAETEAQFGVLAARYPERRSALIPMLMLAQRERGWVGPESIEYIARYLGLSPSDVDSVASFYTLLHRKPVGRNVVLVCTNISCMLCGSDQIEAKLRDRLGIGWGETTKDGRFTLVEAECLGSCTTAPVLQINGTFHENLTIEKVEALVETLRSGDAASVDPSPEGNRTPPLPDAP